MGTSSDMSTSNGYVKYHITINQNSQSVENNTSNVSVFVNFWRTNSYTTYGSGTIYCKINGTTYSASVSPSQKITSSGIDLFSKTLDIGHNSDGTKTLDTSAWISMDTPLSSSEQGYSQTLTTIPRASSVSGGSGNIGSGTTININRMSSNFVHSLYWVYGSSGWVTIATDVGTSYSWTIPTSFYSLIPNSNSGTGTIYCETYNGGTYIGLSSTSFTFNVTNSNPNFTSSQLTYRDTNSTITAITGNNQQIVRNKSTLQAVFTAATARNSATISKYQVTFNGATQEKTSASTISYGTVDSSSDLTLSVKAIDSRGNSTTISKTVTFLDWVLPTAAISASRQNNYETTTYLTATATISSVNSKNSLQELKYRNKKTSDTSYSAYTNLTSGTQATISIDNLYAWDFQVVVTDKFGSTTYNLVVAKGKPIMFFDTGKLSVGVNRLPTSTGTLEVGGNIVQDSYFNGRRMQYVPVGIGTTYGWYLALSGAITIQYENLAFALHVTEVFSGASGILYANIRVDNYVLSVNSFRLSSTGNGLPMSNFILKVNGSNFYLYAKTTASYQSYLFEVISESTLTNQINTPTFTFNAPGNTSTVSTPTGTNPSTYGPQVLYSNASGTQNTITLSEAAANFSCFEVYFRDDDWSITMTKVYSPHDKRFCLTQFVQWGSDNNYIYWKSARVYINGTSLTWDTNRYAVAGTAGGSVESRAINPIYILQVIGYR